MSPVTDVLAYLVYNKSHPDEHAKSLGRDLPSKSV